MPKANETTETAKASREVYPGVDPETGERLAVTLDGLKKEFGSSRGQKIYDEIRGVLTEGRSNAFATGGVVYSPDLSLVGIKADMRARVDEVLAQKEV